MPNVIEESKSSRATCRTCRQKIEKGVLRFGEEMQNQFDPDGAPGYFWHHLTCAAKKKGALVKPVLDAYAGEVPNRAEVDQLLASGGSASSKDRPFPHADRAPTSRAKCLQCGEPIEKGTMRVAIEREVDTGSFNTKSAGYLHPACATEHTGDAELLVKIKANSSGTPAEDLTALEAEMSAS